MDTETLGKIEEEINRILELEDFSLPEWVQKHTILKEPQEFMLGYMLGLLWNDTQTILIHKKYAEQANKRFNKRMKKKFGKSYVSPKEQIVDEKKKLKPIKVELPEEDLNKIRDMLRRRIPDFRVKIYKDFNK